MKTKKKKKINKKKQKQKQKVYDKNNVDTMAAIEGWASYERTT